MTVPKISFKRVPIGRRFRYDNDLFEKTDERCAWEIRDGRHYKEWGFRAYDRVTLISTMDEVVARAQNEMASWPDDRIDALRLQGGGSS